MARLLGLCAWPLVLPLFACLVGYDCGDERAVRHVTYAAITSNPLHGPNHYASTKHTRRSAHKKPPLLLLVCIVSTDQAGLWLVLDRVCGANWVSFASLAASRGSHQDGFAQATNVVPPFRSQRATGYASSLKTSRYSKAPPDRCHVLDDSKFIQNTISYHFREVQVFL